MLSGSKPQTFYFKYQMKLEFIPYIEQQVGEFLDFFKGKLQVALPDHKLWLLLCKKIKQIEKFHYDNWNDFRIGLILPSKRLLVNFRNRNKHYFQKNQSSNIDQKFAVTPRQVLSPETNSKKKVEHEFIGRPSGPKINNLVASKADPVLNKAHNLSSPLLEKPKGQIRNRELTQPGLGRIQNGLSNSKMITKGVEQMLEKQRVKKIEAKKPLDRKMSKEEFIKYLKTKEK